jgi:hypothetical protein
MIPGTSPPEILGNGPSPEKPRTNLRRVLKLKSMLF